MAAVPAWNFAFGNPQREDEVKSRLEDYAARTLRTGPPQDNVVSPLNEDRLAAFMHCLTIRHKGSKWNNIQSFVVLGEIQDVEFDWARITSALRTTPCSYNELPHSLTHGLNVPGNFVVDLALIPVPGAPGRTLVVKVFSNVHGAWKAAEIFRAIGQEDRVYGWNDFGRNNSYAKHVSKCGLTFLAETGGRRWIWAPVDDTEDAAMAAHNEAVAKHQQEVAYIIGRVSAITSKVKQLQRVKLECTNPASPVRHWTTAWLK